jgi:undecaprenyl-diphosphatase
MELIKAILMGLLQGITEFMPVSSFGHMVIINQAFQSDYGTQFLFVILLHMATLLALIIVFSNDIVNLAVAAYGIVLDVISNLCIFLKRLFGRKTEGYYIINSSPYRKFLIILMQTCIAAGVMGLGMRSVSQNVTNSLIATGCCFLINAVLLYITGRLPQGSKKIKNSNSFDAVIIGAVQGFSVFPGLSRMGLSTMAAMALGMEKSFAVKYSLISSIPIIIGSFFLELAGAGGTSLQVDMLANYLIGMIVALVTSVISIRIMLGIIKKYPLTGFAVYSGIIGIISVIFGLVK